MRWIQAFNTAGEDTTLAQMNYGTTATVGNFSPPVDGTIRKIALLIGGVAATSLVELIRVELDSSDWTPNRLHFHVNGVTVDLFAGLRRSIPRQASLSTTLGPSQRRPSRDFAASTMGRRCGNSWLSIW